MQNHSLILRADVEELADFHRAPALDVAEGEDEFLFFGECADGFLEVVTGLGFEEVLLGTARGLASRGPVRAGQGARAAAEGG